MAASKVEFVLRKSLLFGPIQSIYSCLNWKQSAEVRVLEKRDKVCLGRLLKSADGRRLEAKVGLEILGDLANETLEG